MKISKNESIRRLRMLKRIMNRVSKSRARFDMDKWGSMPMNSLRQSLGLRKADDVLTPVKQTRTPERVGESQCGFAGCAMGYAAVNPAMNKLGLYAEFSGYSWSPNAHMTIRMKGRRRAKHCQMNEGFEVGKIFFGVTGEQADHMFMPNYYLLKNGYPRSNIRPHHVIKHIDDVINQIKLSKRR